MISFYSLNKLQSEKQKKYSYSQSNLNSQKKKAQPERPTKKHKTKKAL